EDSFHRVFDDTHDEAVEERRLQLGAGAGQNPAARQEAEITQQLFELRFPKAGRRPFRRRSGARNAPPCIADVAIHRLVAEPISIPLRPDVPGEIYFERVVHLQTPRAFEEST